ncbi:unnamed protein product [Haemonchus placei]|uniref:Reverse transcriptase domain-containing protein n=1 Tax=Haemonchus placei TaxID=6290 RepID=A0A0N4WK02_HAEPC|nr:unnamed protein product [Haemonchus placei]
MHHLRFADDIMLITANIEQEERMLAGASCGIIYLRLNGDMRDGMVPDQVYKPNVETCCYSRTKQDYFRNS